MNKNIKNKLIELSVNLTSYTSIFISFIKVNDRYDDYLMSGYREVLINLNNTLYKDTIGSISKVTKYCSENNLSILLNSINRLIEELRNINLFELDGIENEYGEEDLLVKKLLSSIEDFEIFKRKNFI